MYKSALLQLPHIVYYPGGAGTWGIATVVNILFRSTIFAAQVCFIAIHRFAFILETHVYLVQMKALLESFKHFGKCCCCW
ncbi:hypothetical protein JG688_00016137 [Phytophthora aleatoria]|uniref:Uncharacterized protein n=1 Tax=Phytophthora aleatoria TaxID=2496075 RepID=A0A8J5MCM6_9STRA|nr:hypothetical protein JG688_00016137 [Phytophthora aleatoria]